MIGVGCDQNASVDFEDDGDASLLQLDIVADEPWYWASDSGISNPLTGNPVDEVQCSNGSVTEATLKIAIQYDSVT